MNSLEDLKWFSLQFGIKNIKPPQKSMKSQPLVTFNSIVKNITNRFSHYTDSRIFFHVKGYRFPAPIRKNISYTVQVLFFGKALDFVDAWRENARQYFEKPDLRNFELSDMGAPEARSGADFLNNISPFQNADEVCLDFLTPLPFTPPEPRRRFYLSPSHFLSLMEKRFSDFSESPFSFPEKLKETFHLLPYYWEFQDPHQNRGDGHRIKGCTGRLYLKGELKELLPYLSLASEVHIGGQFSYSYGYFRLEMSSAPFFNSHYRNKNYFFKYSQMIFEESDRQFEKKDGKTIGDIKDFSEGIWNELSSDTYSFSPTRAIHIEKSGSNEKRRIELLTDEDYLVERFLLNMLQPVFDRIFEESSMGYRKGRSAQDVERRVWELLEQGYHHILESDIEDFFPSISHAQLEKLLKHYLPQKDHFLVPLLLSAVTVPFVLKGRVIKRSAGIPQGSPLSPMLTNLYLDSFDEQFLGEESVLVRYSDDFIVLSKTEDEAEKAALKTKLALEEISLRPKQKKTRLFHFTEGFHFLGTYFSPEGPRSVTSPAANALKKTLYVTEPFAFLSLNGEALEIKKNGYVVQSLPLRRISSVITLERVSFSSGLIRKCTDLGIPTTLTMNSGYYVTTIRPDSKKYYDTLTAHGGRFSSLSEGEKLVIAGKISGKKIFNYRAFLTYRKKRAGKEGLPAIDTAIKRLKNAEEKIGMATTVQEMRGIEGSRAKNLFSLYNSFFNQKAFHFVIRDRKRKDPANALFNFGYYLLFTRLNTLVRVNGLNPYLGFLHSEADRYESLTCDLEEMFRSRIDQFLCAVINLKVITEKDFDLREKGLYLTREKKKIFLELFERNLVEKKRKNKLSFLEALEWQVKSVKNWAETGSPLEFYSWEMT